MGNGSAKTAFHVAPALEPSYCASRSAAKVKAVGAASDARNLA